MFAEAGLGEAVGTHTARRGFLIEAWVHTDVKGWTLADLIDDGAYALLLREAAVALRRYAKVDGIVIFDTPALIVRVAA